MRYQDIPVKDVIEKIKERVAANQMNLLVGAGASCCACSLYPDWVELMSDMVACLYPEELEGKDIEVKQDPRYYCHYDLSYRKDPKDRKYVSDTVKAIVDREGMLAIPSRYAKRMGFREAIEAYIESHTPRIDIAGNTVALRGETRAIDKEKELSFLTDMLNVGWNAIFTTNYDDLLRYASIGVGKKSLTECSESATLSLRKMEELVIKLHGNIDFTHERNGFDGDVHRKYVLTQEDYDDYPSKHEAFMQLMRISLLKDCFCLVGFSGKDPNFIAWITWVRDILEAKRVDTPEIVKAEEIKIFFIDGFDHPLDEATRQFFDNHKIYRIILPSSEVCDIIGFDETAPADRSDAWRRAVYSKFFDYVKVDKEPLPTDSDGDREPEPSDKVVAGACKGEGNPVDSYAANRDRTPNDAGDAIKAVPESYTLWSNAYTLSGKFYNEVAINIREARELLSLRSHMRIVRATHHQSRYLDSISGKERLTELEAQLALLALEQLMYVTDEDIPIFKKIRQVLKDRESRERIGCLENRLVTLENPAKALPGKINTDRAIYEKCLRLAFTFDFHNLKEVLHGWNPEPEFAINKAVLLGLVDKDACSRMLTTDMLNAIPTRVERYRATQLANMLYGALPNRFSVKDYSSLSSGDLYSLRDWFFGKSLQPNEKIQSYGHTESPEPVDRTAAVRSLQFLIEVPVFLQLNMWRVVDNVQWYKVAHLLFERYPYPVMFYSSTTNDTNTLRRIGQDYAYSSVLHKQLPGIVKRMFSLLTDAKVPLSYWRSRNLCILLGELIKAVPSGHWNGYALQLWNGHNERLFEEGLSNDELYRLIRTALSCTNDTQFVATVIKDTLEKVRVSKKYDLAQNLLYYSRTGHNKKISNLVEQSLAEFVDGVCDVRDYILLGNLYRVIKKKQMNRIVKTIPRVLRNAEMRTTSVNGLTFFAKEDDTALALVRKFILSNPSLWDNGICDDGAGPCDFVPIAEIDQELKWTKEEVLQVYGKLVASARRLMSRREEPSIGRFMNRENLYGEMMRFMDLHRDELQEEDCAGIYRQLEEEFKALTSYVNIEESIYSENEESLRAALKALSRRIGKEGIRAHLNTVNILITRILCKNRHGYQTALDYLQYFVRFYAKDKETLEAIPQLLPLMDSLTMDVFRRLKQNVLLCTELTILMARHIHRYGINGKGVTYWMKIKRSNFFNWTICDVSE